EPGEQPFETVARAADGSSFPVAITLTRVEEIEPPAYTAALRDLTERAAWQSALNLHGTVLNAAGSGIVIADATQLGAPLVYVNPAFERITGYTSAEVVGKNWDLLHGAETETAAIETISAALERGDECSITLVNYRKDG